MLQTMHTLKSYYWVVKPERENGVCLKGLDINRPSEADIVTIRFEYFTFICQMSVSNFKRLDSLTLSVPQVKG